MSEQERPSNRVWIELETPWLNGKSGKLDHELGRQRAKLASNLLRRLAPDDYSGHYDPVWWSERELKYAFTIDRAGGYVTAADNGHWFNLDYFGREG